MRYTAVCKWTRGRFTIGDEAGTPQFEAVRTDGLAGNIVSVLSPRGDKLAVITPRYGPTRSEIAIADQQPITVRHHGWFGRQYDISTPKGEMSATVGDFSAAGYEITSSGAVRAAVSRELMRQQNLTIDVTDGEDAISLIAIVLAIETLRDDRRQNQQSIPYLRLLLRLIN
jgi:uncharacterized protein YxjI